MRRVKPTVVIDEHLLRRFKELVLSKNNSSRGLSSELEEAIKAFSPLEIIRSAETELGINVTRYPSLGLTKPSESNDIRRRDCQEAKE